MSFCTSTMGSGVDDGAEALIIPTAIVPKVGMVPEGGTSMRAIMDQGCMPSCERSVARTDVHALPEELQVDANDLQATEW